MERIFETKLVLKKGTSVSNFGEEVVEYHYGIGWTICVENDDKEGVGVSIYCQENVARRVEADYLVVFEAEISMGLGTEIIPITTKTKVTKQFLETILDKNLREQLEAHIVRSDAQTKLFTRSRVHKKFLQIVHKKSPAFPVEIVPQVYQLAKRFAVGPAKEYCEWYLFQCIKSNLEYAYPSFDDHKNTDRIMKKVFPNYQPITETDWTLELEKRLNELCLSTMEENYRKPEKFVISLEMVEFCKGCIEEKKLDYFGLSWTTSIESGMEGSCCYLKCDELYRLDWGDPIAGSDIPGWCVVVNVKVFAWFEEKKILVGSENNGAYDHVLQVLKVELSKEHDWSSMSAGDVRFEIDVEIVKAAATRHLSLEDFSKEKKGWTDVVLVAGGRQFHVNKKTLAQSSEVFADTFKTHGSVARQLQLDENDPEAFHMFLQLSHGASTFIKDKEIPGMITMARKYKSKTVLDACTESILHYSHESFPDNVVESLNQLNCPLTWETLVQEENALSSIDARSVTDVGLNIMFRRAVEVKIERRNRGCWLPTAMKYPESMSVDELAQYVENYNTLPRSVKLQLYHIAERVGGLL